MGFFAHAPTELEITPPPGSRHITAEFGLNPAAYDRSDGVEFEIVVVSPNGVSRRLFYRWLQPGTVGPDRGFQTCTLDTTAPIEGTVIFRTLPGPAHNSTCDWAYWSSIKVN
jgi:hypothetical protein